jgi:diacylglycerol O-acyltransferase / wax synthase
VSEPIQLERLSPLDASNLRVEDQGVPMHVAALVILDRTPLGSSREDGLEAVRAAVERRLHLAPRLRQVLYRPRPGLGPAVWVDQRGFDIRRHVLARAVPEPGDEEALLSVCAELNSGRLDRSRPLWEMWVLDGLTDGRAAILIRLHHAVADGIAAMAMIAALSDPGPGPAGPVPAAPDWVPRPAPGALELAADDLRRQGHAAASAVAMLRHPMAVAARLRILARQAGRLAREGRAARVSLNVPVGEHRRIWLLRADLEHARTAAHAAGGTVNDVVLDAVADGARALLAARGELRPGLTLKASVPVSVRGPADRRAAGNRVGVMLVPLPVGDADTCQRLARIARATAERKQLPPVQPNARIGQRWMVRAMPRQRLVNLLTSDLPGPTEPRSFAGVQALELFQIGVVQGNIPISVGALSYAGQLNFAVVADSDAVPDLASFAAGMSAALEKLDVLAEPRGRPGEDA